MFNEPFDGAVDAGFENVRRGDSCIGVKAIYPEEEDVGMNFLEVVLGKRADERRGFAPQVATDQDEFASGSGKLDGNVYRVCNDSEGRMRPLFCR